MRSGYHERMGRRDAAARDPVVRRVAVSLVVLTVGAVLSPTLVFAAAPTLLSGWSARLALVAALVALAAVSLVGARRDLRWSGGVLLGLGAVAWLFPTLPGSSHDFNAMPCIVGIVPIALAYVMIRIALDRAVAPPTSGLAATAWTALALMASSVLAICAARDPRCEVAWTVTWNVPWDDRVGMLGAGYAFAAAALAVSIAARRRWQVVWAAVDAEVTEPGRARARDGRTFRVPVALGVGALVLLPAGRPRATYRTEELHDATVLFRATREPVLASIARQIQALDALAIGGGLAIAAPASADLSRCFVVAFAGG